MQPGLPSIIYIGGYGRSGSTLLDRILGQHPKVFSGGELWRYQEFATSNQLCGCGKPVLDCQIWCEVRQLTDKASTHVGSSWLNGPLGLFLGNKALPAQIKKFVDNQRCLFESVSAVTGATAIVDSSKTAYGAAGRPQALNQHTGMDVYFIHLIRHPYAVWASLSRGTNKQLEGRQIHSGPRQLSSLRAAIGWRFANEAAIKVAEALGPDRAITVRYEDLVHRTREEVERLGTFLQLDLGICLDVLAGRRLPREQHIGEGNRSRSSPLKLNVNQDLVDLPQVAKLALDAICGGVMRKFGYVAVPALGD